MEAESVLTEERMSKVLFLESIDSTNLFLKNISEEAPDRQVVMADEQTRGRGRLGRSFESPKNKGIYLSYLMRPSSIPEDTALITAWTAVAVCRAVKKICNIEPGIKWVNDLILNNKKFCGILTEMDIDEHGKIRSLIIGIGVNVNEDTGDLDAALKDKATSLKQELGREINRNVLAFEIIRELDRMYDDWPDEKEGYLNEYRRYSIMTGKDVSVTRIAVTDDKDLEAYKKRYGRVLGIGDDFSLTVEFDDGSRENLNAGEVSVRGMYGYAR
ncbi:MAG: biotin--[acetyl-CoA-carboxylase] ligase [Lachnospiraceae bacterium]|nr:biotin--[acetyl-CoA-carboxylase] ligase [Lachnospiraceae bacterium]